MAAIITEQFRKNSVDLLLADMASSKYYVGIGQQDEWDDVKGGSALSPYPTGTLADEARAMNHLTGLFRVQTQNIFRVIPRNTVTAGERYKVYDPYDPTCFYEDREAGLKPCYVMAGNRIFLCVHKDQGGYRESFTTTVASVNLLTGPTASTYGVYRADGHSWAYVGLIENLSEINTPAFAHIGAITDATTSALRAAAATATGGMFYGIKVINGGNVYVTNDPNAGTRPADSTLPAGVRTHTNLSINISGTDSNDGLFVVDDMIVSANINNVTGEIFSIDLSISDSMPLNHPDFARAKSLVLDLSSFEARRGTVAQGGLFKPLNTLPQGSDLRYAVAAPIIAPLAGFGRNKYDVLPSWYIGIFSDTSSVENVYLPSGTKYHQICLLRDPLNASSAPVTDSYVQPLSYFTLGSANIPAGVSAGWRIVQFKTAEYDRQIGIVSHVQAEEAGTAITPRVYYYSDFKYGETPFFLGSGYNLKFISPDGQTTQTLTTPTVTRTAGGYLPGTGKVMFIDNRSAITREEGQNEELKIIIQL